MAKFHVRDVFELPERQLFVLAGSVVEGEISKGMLIHVPFNPRFHVTERIYAVERLTSQDGVSISLCVKADDEMAEFWRGMNVKDDILEVTVKQNGPDAID